MRETGWQPVMNFETGLALSIEWYRSNPVWLGRVRSGAYGLITKATTAIARAGHSRDPYARGD